MAQFTSYKERAFLKALGRDCRNFRKTVLKMSICALSYYVKTYPQNLCRFELGKTNTIAYLREYVLMGYDFTEFCSKWYKSWTTQVVRGSADAEEGD